MPDDLTLSDGAVRIPLRRHDGSIRAHAIVDAADAAWANQWRWSLSTKGYAYRGEQVEGRRQSIFLHRQLLGLKHNQRQDGDHIDRDKLNCRRSNLRILPKGKNQHNLPSYTGSTSQYRGVSWDKKQLGWRAQITVNGRNRNLGTFADEAVAAEVASRARARLLEFSVD